VKNLRGTKGLCPLYLGAKKGHFYEKRASFRRKIWFALFKENFSKNMLIPLPPITKFWIHPCPK